MLRTFIRWAGRRYLKEIFTPISAVDWAGRQEDIDFSHGVGSGYRSNVLMSPVSWVARNFLGAPLVVEQMVKGDWSQVDSHPMLDLIHRPNAWHTGSDLWDASVKSWFLDGNSYWVKIRNGSGRPIELWFVPPHLMEPKRREGAPEFVTHFEYSPDGRPRVELDPEDVVHFRNGIDVDNPRKGTSILKTLLREVFTDDEASRYTGYLLKNMGVPGLVVRPKDRDDHQTITDADILKKQIDQRLTGSKRGSTMVTAIPLDITQIGIEPRRMDLGALRNITEERVCAAIGVPPSVVNFGTGVQQTKVGATTRENRAEAWYGAIIPMMVRMAEQLDLSLLPEFETRPNVRTRFASEEIEALQEGEDERAKRNIDLFTANLIKRSEARTDLGWEVGPGDEAYSYELMPRIQSVPFGDPKRLKHQLTDLEATVIASAPRRQANARELEFASAIASEAPALEVSFDRAIQDWAYRFGKSVETAALANLKTRRLTNGHIKQSAEIDATAIMRDLDTAEAAADMEETYTREFVAIGAAIAATVAKGLDTPILPRPERSAALAKARAKLIDLPGQTRARVVREVQAGLEAGEDAAEIAARLAEFVPAGPWKDVATRARVIARNETRIAMAEASLTAMQDSGVVRQVIIYDNLTGFNDEVCVAMDGTIVDLSIADQIVADDHPMGTRTAGPVIPG